MVVRYVIIAVVVVFVAFRIWRRSHGGGPMRPRLPRAGLRLPEVGGSVGLVAEREIRERLRSRTFRIGTIVILLVVVLGIVIPVINRNNHSHPYKLAVVGALSAQIRQTVLADATAVGVSVQLVDVPDTATAQAELAAGTVDLVIVDGERLVVDKAISPDDSSGGALFVGLVATSVARQRGIESAGFTPAQAARLANPAPLPVTSLQPAAAPGHHRSTEKTTALYGLILIYVLLAQYGTWIMMGVVEEKSSRVVEVLLSAMKPAQLLAGKVLGIGSVALAQAATLVVVALVLAAAVGSDLVKGAAPTQVVSILVWLLLGYAFYCWVYAAGGSLADRQEHVQTLAFPLQIPILFGYISSLISLGSTNPSTFVHVLAYIPLTAPFAMNVLVADGSATWWQFVLSALISIAGTVAIARLATMIYRRAVLQTGRRLKLSEVLTTAS